MFKLLISVALISCAMSVYIPIQSPVYAAAPATVYKTPDKDTAQVAVSNSNGNYAYSISEQRTPGQTVVAAAPVRYVAPAPVAYAQPHYVASAGVPYVVYAYQK